MPINGPWNAIAISQTGGGNTLQGAITSKSGSTSASLTANYTGTIGSAGNVHALTIGATTPPLNPSVTVNIENNDSTGANSISDTIDGASLTYSLGLQGSANTVTNTLSAGTGGRVSAALMVSGNSNSLINTVTTTGGNITLIQGGPGYGITGDGNMVKNTIGQTDHVEHVGSFSQTLLVSGSNNTITNTVDSAGDKVVNQSLSTTSSNNMITTSVSGGGTQTANLTLTNSSYVDYAITSTASNTYAAVTIANVTGTGVAPATVRVYQNTPNASLTTSSTGAAPGYTVTITQY